MCITFHVYVTCISCLNVFSALMNVINLTFNSTEFSGRPNRGSVVGIESSLRDAWFGVRNLEGSKYFSLLTGCGAHPTLYSYILGFFTGGKAIGSQC